MQKRSVALPASKWILLVIAAGGRLAGAYFRFVVFTSLGLSDLLLKLKSEKVPRTFLRKLNHTNSYKTNATYNYRSFYVLLYNYNCLTFCSLLSFPFSHESKLTFLQVYSCFKAVRLAQGQHDITQSADYRLRQALFSRYDRMVRPVLKASDVINVTFQVDFKALAQVVSLR